MSFASEIARIKSKVTDAYSACDAKGATMPAAADQKLNNLPATILTIPQTAPGSSLDLFIDGTLTAIDSNVTAVKKFAFYCDKDIISVNLPNALQIGHSAFSSAEKLYSVAAPKVTQLSPQAFNNARKLFALQMGDLESIGYEAFYSCEELPSINFPKVTSIPSSAFYHCVDLENVSLQNVQDIGTNAFFQCTSLSHLVFPKLQRIRGSAFAQCTSLTVLVLRYNGVCTLDNENAFGYTPFASTGSGGTVYVPNAYLNDYKADTVWNRLYDNGNGNLAFAAIEGSAYDT